MNCALRIKNIQLFLILIFLIALDQFSKYLIRSNGGFFICNSGVAFGITIPPTVFWTFWLAIIAAVTFKLFTAKLSGLYTLSLSLVLAGALSNVIDRLASDCVTDFIDFKFWPLFNLADTFIVIGVVMLIIKISKK